MVRDKQHNFSRGQRSEDLSQNAKGTNTKSNPQAEQILLAALIASPNNFYEFAAHLQDADFSVHEHAQVFYVLNHFYSQSNSDQLTQVTFEAAANDAGFGTLCNNETITELFNYPISDNDNLWTYFYQIKKESIRRKYHEALWEISDYLEHTTDNATSVIGSVEEKIMSVSDILKYGEQGVRNLAEDTEKIIMKMASDPGRSGLDIGLPTWCKYVGEMSPGTVHLVIANMKVGKSQLGMHAAVHVASKYKIPVLLCDSEMNQDQQTVRAFGMYMKIPYWILKTGYWTLDDEQLIKAGFVEGSPELFQVRQARLRMQDKEAWATFKNIPLFYLSINGMTLGDAIPFMRRWIMRHTNIDRNQKRPQAFLVYDYLKLPSFEAGAGNLAEYQLLGLYTGQLHDFVNQYHLPCLTFGQTNREMDRSLNCIASSKRLGELADSVSMLFRKNEEERIVVPNGTHGLDVLAAREGISTNDYGGYINFTFERDMGHITELGYVTGREEQPADGNTETDNQNSE